MIDQDGYDIQVNGKTVHITPPPPWVEAYLDSLRSDAQRWPIKLPDEWPGIEHTDR